MVAVEIEAKADALAAEVVRIARLDSREPFDLGIVVRKNTKGETVTRKVGADLKTARDALSRLVEHFGNGDIETLPRLILNKELDADVLDCSPRDTFIETLLTRRSRQMRAETRSKSDGSNRWPTRDSSSDRSAGLMSELR